MTTAELSTLTTLDATLLSLFAKASYGVASDGTKPKEQDVILRSWLEPYYVSTGQTNPGWKVLTVNGKDFTSYSSGFDGVAYGLDSNNDGIYEEIVVSYAGSQEVIQDWIVNDGEVAMGKIPSQTTDATIFCALVKGEYCKTPETNLTLTGHSLGGALAQQVQLIFGDQTVTFNAPGVATGVLPSDPQNVINYVNMNDFVGSFGTHVGETRYYLPNSMEGDDFKPHSAYYGQDFSKYITLPVGFTWTLGQSLALWGYDANNTNTALKTTLSAFVTEANLDSGARLVQQYFGNTNKLTDSFHYFSLSKGYIIGSKESNILVGKDSTSDTIWGNNGDDNIFGKGGKDVIYGGYGDDSIYGGKGNDTLYGSFDYDKYIFATGDGIDSIRDTEEITTSIKGINYKVKQGNVEVNSSILTGGKFNETTNKYESNNVGVSYTWDGVNGSNLIINYGTNDKITVYDFNNGDLGILFDKSIVNDKTKINDQLKRDMQVLAEIIAKGGTVDNPPKLIYKDVNGKIYNAVNSDMTDRILNVYGEILQGGIYNPEDNFLLIQEGVKFTVKPNAVNYNDLVTGIGKQAVGHYEYDQLFPADKTLPIPSAGGAVPPSLDGSTSTKGFWDLRAHDVFDKIAA